MREAYFRKSRQKYWDDLKNKDLENPDELAASFLELSQDLSYARTFYPNSELVSSLNQTTGQFYSRIYKNKKSEKGAFRKFWVIDLPLILYQSRKQILYSFLFFLLCCLVGALAAKKNPEFINLILGKSYVNMTNENIKKGDPFGVYKDMNPVFMFLAIMMNNIYVSFRIFVYGIFLGGGTLMDLFTNGIMLGSFQYFFFSKGLGWASVLVIWIHGTLEISAIIISGGAGLLLAKGILFPGTYSRMVSLRLAALKGIKIMVGLVPVFMAAAFLESFVTRHDHMPLFLSLLILLLSLFFILYYFVFYPRRLSKKLKIQPQDE